VATTSATDAEPAARRDGRLRAGQRDPDRGHARHPRPGAPAPRTGRPADRRRPPDRKGRRDILDPLEGQAARQGLDSTSSRQTPGSPAPT
jgi:hypothetical protein